MTNSAATRRSRPFDGPNLDVDVERVAEEQTAALQRRVPHQAVHLPIHSQPRAGSESDGLVPGIGTAAGTGRLPHDLTGHIADGQIPVHPEPTLRLPLDAGTREADRRVALDIEKIGGAQIGVLLAAAGGDAGRGNGDLR